MKMSILIYILFLSLIIQCIQIYIIDLLYIFEFSFKSIEYTNIICRIVDMNI